MVDREMQGKKLTRANHIFKAFSEKLLTLSVQITQLFTNIIMYKKNLAVIQRNFNKYHLFGKEINMGHS